VQISEPDFSLEDMRLWRAPLFVFSFCRCLLLVRWVSVVTSRQRKGGPWCEDLRPIFAAKIDLKIIERKKAQGFTR
jgi:hypothetical protein